MLQNGAVPLEQFCLLYATPRFRSLYWSVDKNMLYGKTAFVGARRLNPAIYGVSLLAFRLPQTRWLINLTFQRS